MAAAFTLPSVPVSHGNFISYISQCSYYEVQKAVAPYNQYEAKLREGFAQHRDHPELKDPHINCVPVFGRGVKPLSIRGRDTSNANANEKYVMPLKTEDRRPEGSPATAESLQDFRKNFKLFSESSLVDLDWNHVVAAGSSVVTALLPVPDKYRDSKKALR